MSTLALVKGVCKPSSLGAQWPSHTTFDGAPLLVLRAAPCSASLLPACKSAAIERVRPQCDRRAATCPVRTRPTESATSSRVAGRLRLVPSAGTSMPVATAARVALGRLPVQREGYPSNAESSGESATCERGWLEPATQRRGPGDSHSSPLRWSRMRFRPMRSRPMRSRPRCPGRPILVGLVGMPASRATQHHRLRAPSVEEAFEGTSVEEHLWRNTGPPTPIKEPWTRYPGQGTGGSTWVETGVCRHG